MPDDPADRIPSSKSMEIPILECLKDGADWRTKDINNYVADVLGMTKEDRRIPQGKGNTFLFANRVGWGCDNLKRKGFIEKQGYGLWKITPDGQNKLKNMIISPVLTLQTPVPADDEDDEEYPTKVIKKAYEEYLKKIKKQLLSNIHDNDPEWFENFVKELLLKMGYGEFGSVTPKTRDGGIDVIISEDPLELGKIYAQAKRYKEDQPVPVKDIREFKQVIGNKGNRGIFVTTSYFAKDAINEKETLVLIDGDRLAELMIKYNIGISVRENYPVFDIDEKFFIPEDI